jgi:hypothetical protein
MAERGPDLGHEEHDPSPEEEQSRHEGRGEDKKGGSAPSRGPGDAKPEDFQGPGGTRYPKGN